VTPDKFQVISKRNWEGQVKAWRRRLHEWDVEEDKKQERLEEGEIPFWKTEDEQFHEALGGLAEWERKMTEQMRTKMDEAAASKAVTDSATTDSPAYNSQEISRDQSPTTVDSGSK
jgi:hypothetical protein